MPVDYLIVDKSAPDTFGHGGGRAQYNGCGHHSCCMPLNRASTDKAVSSSDYSVQVYQGHVTLTGGAKSPEESKLAAADIRAIPGVKSVKNDVRVAQAEGAAVPK
jgi:hypothetical protein